MEEFSMATTTGAKDSRSNDSRETGCVVITPRKSLRSNSAPTTPVAMTKSSSSSSSGWRPPILSVPTYPNQPPDDTVNGSSPSSSSSSAAAAATATTTVCFLCCSYDAALQWVGSDGWIRLQSDNQINNSNNSERSSSSGGNGSDSQQSMVDTSTISTYHPRLTSPLIRLCLYHRPSSSSYSFCRVRFGVPMVQVCKQGVIPAPLLVMMLKLNKEGPYRRDVFRAPGHQAQITKLTESIQQGRLVNIEHFSVSTVASVVKKFLRKLPNGLFEGDANESALIEVVNGWKYLGPRSLEPVHFGGGGGGSCGGAGDTNLSVGHPTSSSSNVVFQFNSVNDRGDRINNPHHGMADGNDERIAEVNKIITSLPVASQHLLILLIGTFRLIHSHTVTASPLPTARRMEPPTENNSSDRSTSATSSHPLRPGMTAEALAVSITPSLFHTCIDMAKEARIDDIKRLKLAGNVITFLVSQFGDRRLFGDANYQFYARITGNIIEFASPSPQPHLPSSTSSSSSLAGHTLR